MHALSDIFAIWGSLAEFSRDIGVPYQTVAKWSQRGRIPPESWESVIDAARRRKVVLTTSLLVRTNKPRKNAGSIDAKAIQ